MKHNIAVVLSGNGSNLKAIIDKRINVSFVVSNNPKSLGFKSSKRCKYTIILLANILELRRGAKVNS